MIRQAKINDWLEVARIDREHWSSNRNADYIPDGEHVWRLWVEYAFIAVTELEGKIVGFILAFPTNKKNLYFVHKLLLHKDFRQKGLGSDLMKICNEYADNHKLSLMLTTDSNNLGMQKLCVKSGYNEKEFQKGYYRPEENRYVYTRHYQDLSAEN